MSTPKPLDYRSAGVDIDAADDSKNRIKAHVESTFTKGTRGAFGGFGGMFKVPGDLKDPILVSSADGVGTKIKIAIEPFRLAPRQPDWHPRPRPPCLATARCRSASHR